MRSRMLIFTFALKIALLAPTAAASFGVIATHAEAAGVTAPVTKVPHVPIKAPASTATRTLDADAPLHLANAHTQLDRNSLDVRAGTDDLHLRGKGLVPDRVVQIDIRASGDGGAIVDPPVLKSTAQQRRLDAPFAPQEKPSLAPDGVREAAPLPRTDDITSGGADAVQAPFAPHLADASPQHVAATGTSAPPTSDPARASASPVAVAAAAGAAFLLLLASLYARLRGASALANEKRARLLSLLREAPGMTTADAARALTCDATTARHHLRTLVREGFAADHAGRFFAAGEVPAGKRDAHLAASDSAHVLDAVRAAPGASKQQIADALDVARATVSWHLKRLQQAGLVRSERDGKCVRLYATTNG